MNRPWLLGLLRRGPADSGSVAARVAVTVLIVVGAALAVYSGYIHLHLWGLWGYPYPYKHYPTIGPLFLLQGIGAILIGLLVAISRRLFAVLVGAGLMVVSVAALVIDVEVGMFGFKDSWSVPYAKSTLYEEIVGAVVLLIAVCVLAWPGVSGRSGRGR